MKSKAILCVRWVTAPCLADPDQAADLYVAWAEAGITSPWFESDAGGRECPMTRP